MRKPISKESLARMKAKAKSLGFTEAPRDHPIYSEGLSLTLSHRMPKQSHHEELRSSRVAIPEFDVGINYQAAPIFSDSEPMRDHDDEFDVDQNACPFCATAGDCEHLLLVVDLTFLTSDGGALFEAFAARWSKICDQRVDGDDECVPFEDLLDEVEVLSDASFRYVVEEGPGNTPAYGSYFCSSSERLAVAIKSFEAG